MAAHDFQALKDRTKSFALRVIILVDSLPNAKAARVIGDQLLRSGTSVGANYRAACRARSKADFVSKIGIVEEEADESAYWIELLMESGKMKSTLLIPLYREAMELPTIMSSSRKTAQRGLKKAA